MEDFPQKFENGPLSLEEEMSLESNLSMQLLFAETTADADEIMKEIAEVAEYSQNGRTLPKIEDCVNTLKLNCSGGNISDVILNSISTRLFPIFHKNIIKGDERVILEDIERLAKNLDPVIGNPNINSVGKVQIAKDVFKLFRILNGTSKRER